MMSIQETELLARICRLEADWRAIAGRDFSQPRLRGALDELRKAIAREAPAGVAGNLNGLGLWDGVERLPEWAHVYLGSPPEDTRSAEFGMKWMIGAVARALYPGCSGPGLLLLKGAQGIGGGTALLTLAGSGHLTTDFDCDSSDAAVQLAGSWIVEAEELAGYSPTKVRRFLDFARQRSDRLRMPYESHFGTVRRSCVFVATTVDDSFIPDCVGTQWIWPVQCGRIHVAGIRRDRDQLWAEAVVRYRRGEAWWIEAPAQAAE